MRTRLVALLLASLGVAGAAPVGAPGGAALQPRIEPARGGECVAEPATMRREHMTMLQHQRDDTVRGGVRGAKASLKACIECHASTQTGSVATARSDFCISCHSYAAVKIDCFECHASRPAGGTAFHRLAPVPPVHHAAAARLEAQLKQMGAAP